MIDNFDSLADVISVSRYRCWENELIQSADLADFCSLLRSKTTNADVREACKSIIDFITGGEFVFKKTNVGIDVHFATGLGIYFPTTGVSRLYRDLDMIDPNVTPWFEFLGMFVEEQLLREDEIND
jgi:hypothetical protein